MAKKNKNIRIRHPWRNLFRDLLTAVKKSTSAVDYIREYELWKGLNKYRWLSKALVIIAIIIGVSFFRFINQWYKISDVSHQGIFGLETGLIASMLSAGKEIFLAGSYKYIMLLLVEVLVFHFVRKTLIVVTGEHINTDFKTFLSTQIRMVGVTIACAVFEGLFSKLFSIPLGWLGLQILNPAMFLIVQAYFMGVVIVDNYNEVYHMTLKQSMAYCWQYAGVTIVVGSIVSILFIVPLLGIIVGPILGAVIAARTMHYLYSEDLDKEWVFKRYPKKVKAIKVESSTS